MSISQEDASDVMTTLSESEEGELADNKLADSKLVYSEAARRNGVIVRSALDGALDALTDGIVISLAAGTTLLLGSQVVLRAGVWMQPRPMPYQQAALLAHPLRLRYRNPSELMGQLGIFAAMSVADLGCGTGLFTLEMAKRVGDTGQVHAVDIQEPMIGYSRERIAAAGLSQRVRFYHSGIHTLPLQDKSVDVALMAAVLGELPARTLALDEVRRVLRPGGRLAISEELPDPAYAPTPLVRRWAEEAGFRYGGLTGNPFCYTMLFFVD